VGVLAALTEKQSILCNVSFGECLRFSPLKTLRVQSCKSVWHCDDAFSNTNCFSQVYIGEIPNGRTFYKCVPRPSHRSVKANAHEAVIKHDRPARRLSHFGQSFAHKDIPTRNETVPFGIAGGYQGEKALLLYHEACFNDENRFKQSASIGALFHFNGLCAVTSDVSRIGNCL
jgi:hypothetical protein